MRAGLLSAAVSASPLRVTAASSTAARRRTAHALPTAAAVAARWPAATRSLSSAASASTSTALSAAAAARLLSTASSSRRAPLRHPLEPQIQRSSSAATGTASALASLRSYASSAGRAPIPTSALVEVSKLPNNVTVATEATPGHFSALGVYIDAGSRYERQHVPGESGICHLLDRMAFKSTARRSAEDMTTEISRLGGNFFCSSSRETLMYQASIFNQDLSHAVDILADTVLNPALLEEELEVQKEAASYEIGEIGSKPEMMLPEVLHQVAYADNTLGYPLLCPAESLPHMTAANLRNFVDAWYTPDRIVVAGAGMAHAQLVEEAQKHFGHLKQRSAFPDGSTFASTPPPPPMSFAAQASAAARYTGGERYLSAPELDFTHVYVAFEGLSVHDDDIYALATLQILLGGGGSFSAGGPGKGMYSRLYSNVLNRHHQVDFCAAFHHCYNDSGLFGIAASVHHDFVKRIPDILAHELESLLSSGMGSGGYAGRGGSYLHRNAVTQAELSRARNQLKSSLVMALESRLVEVEDLGRQVQVHGKKVSVEEMCARIDEVDLATLRRVAGRVLRPSSATGSTRGTGLPTVVAQGDLDQLGDVRALLAARGLGASPTSSADPPVDNKPANESKQGLLRRAFFGSGSAGVSTSTPQTTAVRGLHTSAVAHRPAPTPTTMEESKGKYDDMPEFFRPKTRAERAALSAAARATTSSAGNQEQGGEAGPNRHVLFYRDIVPPLLRVLAYGSIVYFGLHLLWVVLDREELEARHRAEIGALEAEVRALKEARAAPTGFVAQGGAHSETKSGRSWWAVLLGK